MPCCTNTNGQHGIKNKPSTTISHGACEKLLSIVRSSTNRCQVILAAIWRAVVYYAQAAHALSAGKNYAGTLSGHLDFNMQNTIDESATHMYAVNGIPTVSSQRGGRGLNG